MVKRYLKLARISGDVPQWLLAKAMGVSRSTLSSWENGRIEIPQDMEVLYFQILKKLKEKNDDLFITAGIGGDSYDSGK